MSAAPARFTFDLDLGHREDSRRLLTESKAAAMVSEARAAAFSEGFAAGENGATAKAARQLAEAAGIIGERVAGHAASLEDMRRATLADAVELSATIARKLATALVGRLPAVEIEALINECIASLDGAPHLVIRCNDTLADAVREIAIERMHTSGFTGRLVVMGDPEIAPGDCRLEWVDGGLVRDMNALSADIDRRIAAFLAARTPKDSAYGAEETD